MTSCMQHNKTRIPKSESISPEYRQFFPARMLSRPAPILSILAVWIGLMLGTSLHGVAAGAPTSWDVYQVTIISQNNNAIAGSGVNDVVRGLLMGLTTRLA